MSPRFYVGNVPGVRIGSNGQTRLPDKLPCDECGHDKAPTAFAKNRLDSFSSLGGDRNPAALKKLICLKCNGAPPTELLCQGVCNKVKGLDKFSGVQRRTPDIAICKQCMYDREAVQPGHMRDFKSNEQENEEDDDDNGVPLLNEAPLAQSMHAPSGDTSVTHGLRKRHDEDEYELLGHSSLATSRAPASTTAHPTGTLHSSSGVAGSAAGTSSGSRSSSNNRADTGNWPKPRSVPHQRAPRPEDSDDDAEVEREEDDGDWEM